VIWRVRDGHTRTRAAPRQGPPPRNGRVTNAPDHEEEDDEEDEDEEDEDEEDEEGGEDEDEDEVMVVEEEEVHAPHCRGSRGRLGTLRIHDKRAGV